MESRLLSPIQLGRRTSKNRIVSAAHNAFTEFYSPRDDGDRYIAYLQRRAAGGCGTLILGAMHVHESSEQMARHPAPDDVDIARKLRRLARECAPYDTTLIQQLFHFGAHGIAENRVDLRPRWSLNGALTPEGEPTHKMSAEDIEAVIDGFVDKAVLSVESGMHGIELHGTHGYLLQQSYSPWGNGRDDEWGEPLRLIREVIGRVRQAVGEEPVVGLRISADDFKSPASGGLGPSRLAEIAAKLVADGQLDYLCHSEGSEPQHYSASIGSYRHPSGEFLELSAGLRKAIGGAVPLIAAGRIATVDLAEDALATGKCDLVAMTRAQIADPDLANKVATKRVDDIRPCVGANVCFDAKMPGIRCFHNPEVGQEHAVLPMVAPLRKHRVLVVGGGPGGLKAAEMAATRGHRVTLVDRESELGGRLRLVGGFGRAADLLASIGWMEQRARAAGVEIQLSTEVTEASMAEYEADTIVIATGSRPADVGWLKTDGSLPLVPHEEIADIARRGKRLNPVERNFLVIDRAANIDVALVIEHLCEDRQVSVVTSAQQYGSRVGFSHITDLVPRFAHQGVEMLTAHEVVEIADGQVRLRHIVTGASAVRECDVVVVGANPVAHDSLVGAARAMASAVHVIGDAIAARGVAPAIWEGDRAARSIGARGADSTV